MSDLKLHRQVHLLTYCQPRNIIKYKKYLKVSKNLAMTVKRYLTLRQSHKKPGSTDTYDPKNFQ